jgi:polyhydroxyalkanoate synthesis repressor PhaR
MVRVIKRYGGGSRKLYDTEESRYISLDEIAAWVRQGQELQVVDSASGDDVTAQTLAQVIYEEHRRGLSLLPTRLLHEMIRRGEAMLFNGVDLVRDTVDRLSPAAGARSELGLLRERLAELEQALGELGGRPAGGVSPGRRSGGRGRRAGRARG